MDHKHYGGIEAGGTKFICGIGSGAGELIDLIKIPTTGPETTLAAIIKFFNRHPELETIGLGSFGPLDLDEKSANYGSILESPKTGWSYFKILSELSNKLKAKIIIATDTDVAAIGEYHYGKANKADRLLYITIGTGIGGTFLISGKPFRGIKNAEMGHIIIPDAMNQTTGACPYHDSCLEGFSSGGSIEKIYGKKASSIDDNDFWDKQAQNIAIGLMNMVLVLQPSQIVIGGIITKVPGLIYKINIKFLTIMNSYIELPSKRNYILKNANDDIGILGAIKLASN